MILYLFKGKRIVIYMKNFFADWQAKDIASILHEKKGGYANNMKYFGRS